MIYGKRYGRLSKVSSELPSSVELPSASGMDMPRNLRVNFCDSLSGHSSVSVTLSASYLLPSSSVPCEGVMTSPK